MGRDDENEFGRGRMKTKTVNHRKKRYNRPHLVQYGSLTQITKGGGGSRRDGGKGSPKTKSSGGA
jgi:hypothetical protein